MEFVKGRINKNKLMQNKLGQSQKAIITVYCFSPGPKILDALLKIPDLAIIYARDYAITKPETLLKLKHNDKELFWVPEEDGKLHAKIYYGKLKNNSEYALVCSANMTQDGFDKNQEAGIMFDTSKNKEDLNKIAEIRKYLEGLKKTYRNNTFTLTEYNDAKDLRSLAKNASKRSEKKVKEEKQRQELRRCWTIKTGLRQADEFFDEQFIKYDVIAHGFEETDGKGSFERFKEINKGDFALICEGYGNRPKAVPIYGAVRVKNGELREKGKDSIDFINDNDSHFKNWIKCWYETEEIVKFSEPVEISRDRLKRFLGKGSLELACQEIDNKENGFYRLLDHLEQAVKG
ncbi:MAG: hypothetical protein PHH57_06565 [Candidatus Omnitrophica bacterium]|nr:hypothetical protein [Candidatus Omnitrophota bacterium]